MATRLILIFPTTIFFLTKDTVSIPINNQVTGDVQIECDASTMAVQIPTENPFLGTVFVKDYFTDSPCFTKGTGRLSAFLRFEIGFCGSFRARTLNPRGTVVDATIVISFHPIFITKVDRSYKVRCIFQETVNTVTSSVSVEDISTQVFNQNVSMPTCSYQILNGGPFGEPVAFGTIGQQVYHQWKCETQNVETFCMLVHTCSTDNGKGEKAFLIDSNGCAIDRFLLSNLEYPMDLMAGQEAHVYKFADRDAMFFQCQISITIKEPGEECRRPVCDDGSSPEGGGGGGLDFEDSASPYGPNTANAAVYTNSISSEILSKENTYPSPPTPTNSITDDLIETSLSLPDVEDLLLLTNLQNQPRTNLKKRTIAGETGETLDVRIKLQVIDSISLFAKKGRYANNNNVCVSSTDIISPHLYLTISYVSSIFFTIFAVLVCRNFYV